MEILALRPGSQLTFNRVLQVAPDFSVVSLAGRFRDSDTLFLGW
jgi:hypothetical protein